MKKDPTGNYIWGYHEETHSEQKLAAALKKAGLSFAREVPIKGFTVDFLINEWLVVEVDGESHLVSGKAEKDAARQKAIEDAGFTVIRVPSSGTSADHDLRRWVNIIKAKADEGPPYRSNQRFENRDYKRQLGEIRKALEAGEAEKRKREALARETSMDAQGRRKRRDSGPGEESEESMEDYFGPKAEDLGALLDNYDWKKTSPKEEEERSSPRRRKR